MKSMDSDSPRICTLLTRSLLFLLAATPLAAATQSRTWTSASDPSRQFEAELVAASEDQVTVRRGDGTEVTFALDVVSQDDQAYVREHREDLPATAENKVYQELSSNMARGTVSARAEYYILYAAASF